ncbi:MAG: hypothetical protein K5778_01855 [Bacteroidaceae bacterium]|nr:hypothetical protein [Bacteroidaceae bacterium]
MVRKQFSFAQGLELLPVGKVKEFNTELRQILGLSTESGLFYKRNNVTRIDEYEAITALFEQYGIDESLIWTEIEVKA